ncbi:TPR repeat-containing protein [Calothrix sp. NIES-4071]|nr:TPR repeat-containing protein [Calothrix sp. NIES-4071]BAZ57063.1 TPR repeat-containing protein [Calothrix sp. NIES-4105]
MNTIHNQAYEYQVGGSLPVNAPSYVKRQADDDLCLALKNGEFCYVLNSRQMGKSSLRVQTMQRLQNEGVACAAIDLTRIGSQDLTSEQWYAGIVRSLVSSFELRDKLNLPTWWREHNYLSPLQRLSVFLEEVLLTHVLKQIIIFIDEIDSILSLNFSIDDFFALVRSFYDKRSDNPTLKRLTFCLLGVATPSDLIKDKKRTPFNIGKAIELSGFELQEAEPLAKGLENIVENPQQVLQEVLKWTGGQPFLTQKVCRLILSNQEKLSIGLLVRSQIIKNWESQDEPEHLRTIRNRILSDEEGVGLRLGLYQQILAEEAIEADDSQEQMELRLTGLVVRRQGKLSVYNRIYRNVFNQRWLKKALANQRPEFYHQAITAWSKSKYQDSSCLLRGNLLKEAQNWATGKNLSREDSKFLTASSAFETQEYEKRLKTHNFNFKNGEASSVTELITLCDQYPEEAQEYLFINYLEDWLKREGKNDLAILSRKIVSSYQTEKRRGLEMFVRGMCESIEQDPYPKIFFEPNEIDFGEMPVGYQKSFHLKITNQGRGFAWGDVIPNGNIPGIKVYNKFDSHSKIFDIDLDTFELYPGNYYGYIEIILGNINQKLRFYIKYIVVALKVGIEPSQLNLGRIAHGSHSIPKLLKVTIEPSDAKIKAFASTHNTYLQVAPSNFESSSLELSLTIDTTSLEAGLYRDRIYLKINNSQFQVPVSFRKPFRWDVIYKWTTIISIPIGLFMYCIRYVLDKIISVGLNDNWVLSYPPEISKASFLKPIYPLNIFDTPDVQLAYSILGLVILFVVYLIIRITHRYDLDNFKEQLRIKVELFLNSINELKQHQNNQNNTHTYITNTHQPRYIYNRYNQTNQIITLIFIIAIILLLLIVWFIVGFIISFVINTFAWVGSSFILILDSIVYPFTIIGIKKPAVAWLILGCLTGGVLGLTQALKYLQQYSYLSKIYKFTIAIVLILSLITSIILKPQHNTDFFPNTLVQDDFKSPSNNWNISSSAKIKNGGLFYNETKKNNVSTSIWSGNNNIIANFDFSASTKKVNGSDDLQFGLIARYNRQTQSNGDNFYYLLIQGNGEFAMGKLSASNKWEDKVGWRKSNVINKGNSINRLRIVCYERKVIGWINDQRVGIFEDDSLTSGQIGFISARGEGDSVAVYFDNVIVKTKF